MAQALQVLFFYTAILADQWDITGWTNRL